MQVNQDKLEWRCIRLPEVYETAKRILKEQGRTQRWVVEKMNKVNPELEMDKSKFSAIIVGKRRMTGDELLAFCMALEVSPDEFTKKEVV